MSEVVETEEVECEACGGTGAVDCDEACFTCGEPCMGEADCEECDGRGIVEKIEPPEVVEPQE